MSDACEQSSKCIKFSAGDIIYTLTWWRPDDYEEIVNEGTILVVIDTHEIGDYSLTLLHPEYGNISWSRKWDHIRSRYMRKVNMGES